MLLLMDDDAGDDDDDIEWRWKWLNDMQQCYHVSFVDVCLASSVSVFAFYFLHTHHNATIQEIPIS